jgi:predicted RND superfamily exporter protein
LKSFFKEFGYDEILVAAYPADNVLNEKHIKVIQSITKEIEHLPGVDRVISLANAEDVDTQNGSLEIVPLLSQIPTTKDEEARLRKRIETNPMYDQLLISRDAKSALFDITLKSNLTNEERKRTLNTIEITFANKSERNVYYLAGAPYGRNEMFQCVRRDFSTLLPLGILLLILSMYLIFKNYLCVLLPFIAISLAVVWTVGSMYLMASELNFLSVLIPTILFIIGTSDCIHILSQYQDCRYDCRTKKQALFETIRLMMLPCFLTTLTTMVGFLSLAICRIQPIGHFGLYSAIGIGLGYILAITLLPIGFSIADTRPFSLKQPSSEIFLRFLGNVNKVDNRHKKAVILASLLAVALGIFGWTKIYVETDLGKFFGRKFKGFSDTLFIEQEFGGVAPLYVVIDSQEEDGLKDPRLLGAIDTFCRYLRQQDGVDKVISASDLIKYMNYRFHDSDPAYNKMPDDRKQIAELLLMASFSDKEDFLSRFFDDQYSKTSIGIRYRYRDLYRIDGLNKTIRSYLRSDSQLERTTKSYTTGTTIMFANAMVPILEGLNQSLFIASSAIFILMVILFRSLWFGLISMVPNLIPILLTLGTMGWLDIPLNIATAPVAAIALGIAIDDTIHFLVRFRREFRRDRDYEKAIEKTLRSVGKPILITSIVLTAGFCIFLFSNFQPTRNLGVLISCAVIGAVFADLIVLPVLLLILKPLGRNETSG